VTSSLAPVRSYPLESLPPPALTTDDNDEVTSPATPQESLPKPDPLPSPSFKEELMAFSILESGVIFHSVIIGLNLGTTSSAQLKSLVIVLIFHQAFEGKPLAPLLICSYHPNPPFSSFCPPWPTPSHRSFRKRKRLIIPFYPGLGLGARLSAIEFPKKYRWGKWALCAGYGLTTPIAIAIGIKVCHPLPSPCPYPNPYSLQFPSPPPLYSNPERLTPFLLPATKHLR
jgi:hypothetical protein